MPVPNNSMASPYYGQQQPRGIIDPTTGNFFPPSRAHYDDYPVPKVIQFSAVLGSAWRKYWHGQHDAALRHDRVMAMAMRHDESLVCLLNERRRSVNCLPWHIEVENENGRDEKFLKAALTCIVAQTPRFVGMRWQALDALWYGRQGIQLRYGWKQLRLPDGKSGTVKRRCMVVTPNDHDDGWMSVNGDKIGHGYDNEPYVLVMGASDDQLPPKTPYEWATISRAVPLRNTPEERLRDRWIIHKHMEGCQDADWFAPIEGDAINGVGIRSFIYFLDWLKKEWLSNISDWIERAGIGVRLWYYAAGNPESRQVVEEAAKSNIHRTNILIPLYPGERGNQPQEGMEWVEPQGSGPELVLRFIEYVDKWHERFIVGQSMSGGVGRGQGSSSHGSGLGGSHWAELAGETKSEVTMSDAAALSDTLTKDYLKILQKYNFPEFEDINCYFRFGKESRAPEKKIEAGYRAWEMGASLKEEEVIEAATFTPPSIGDKILKKPPEPVGGDKPFGGGGGAAPAKKAAASPGSGLQHYQGSVPAHAMAAGRAFKVGPDNLEAWAFRAPHPAHAAQFLRELGLSVTTRYQMNSEDLLAFTNQGRRVIATLQDGACATVVAYHGGIVVTEDDAGRKSTVGVDDFAANWKDGFGIIVGI